MCNRRGSQTHPEEGGGHVSDGSLKEISRGVLVSWCPGVLVLLGQGQCFHVDVLHTAGPTHWSDSG